jgi:hypothetical protein
MRSVGVVNMTWNLRSKMIDENLLKLHKCTIKGETKRKRGHLGKKKKQGGKVGPIYAHGGCVTKKG